MTCLDVLKEDMQEVGAREDEVFGCVGRRHAGGRSEGRRSVWMCWKKTFRRKERGKMKCLDVMKEDIQEVGAREDEVFGCVERRHSGGRSEGR